MERIAEHICEGVTGWDEIYVDDEGDWIFSASAGDSKTEIKFCPFCGVLMETIAPEIVAEHKEKLEEIERNRPPFKPATLDQMQVLLQVQQDYMIAEMMKERNHFSSLFKK